MTSNGAVRKIPAKVSFEADPSGAPLDPEDAPAPNTTGSVAILDTPQVVPGGHSTPTRITAKGPAGEDLTMEVGDDGVWRTIATSTPPPPVSAPVDHPLLGQLRARTRKVRERVQRAPAYNHKMLWFMKPDGEVVKLQGDPGNRAYYEDKGYVVLTAEETLAWERDKKVRRYNPQTGEHSETTEAPSIRKQVIKLQRERAQIISTIRAIAARHAAVEVTGDLSITPTHELQAMLDKLQAINGPNFTLLQAREPSREREYDDDRDSLDGLEVGRGDDLERKVARYREQMQVGGRQRLGPGAGIADLSGNAGN